MQKSQAETPTPEEAEDSKGNAGAEVGCTPAFISSTKLLWPQAASKEKHFLPKDYLKKKKTIPMTI